MMQSHFTLETVFRFGKYAGHKVSSVANFDPTYIFYLAAKDDTTFTDKVILMANKSKFHLL